MQVKKQQLELDIEQWTGSKLGKEYLKDSDSSATPSFPSQPEGKIGLPRVEQQTGSK